MLVKILLTGATGFIGHNLVKNLLNSGYIVYCIVRSGSNISNIDKNANLFIYDGDIDSIISFCKEKKFDGIIHLASFFLSSHKKEDLCGLIESNIKFGTELLEAAKITDVKWFINTVFLRHFLSRPLLRSRQMRILASSLRLKWSRSDLLCPALRCLALSRG